VERRNDPLLFGELAMSLRSWIEDLRSIPRVRRAVFSKRNGSRPGLRGYLRLQSLEDRAVPAINVAVVGGSDPTVNTGFTAIRDQLNNDTYFDFNASVVSASQVDTVSELNAYDVVVIGDPGYNTNQFEAFAGALRTWVQSGHGVVATGWTVYGAGSATGLPVADIDAIVPVNTSGTYGYVTPGSGAVTPTGAGHPVINGVGSFTRDGFKTGLAGGGGGS
jgi:hypothetical protein